MLTKPILVVMVWRGGDRFLRCLHSLEAASKYFSKILISVTSTPDSPDVQAAREFAARHKSCEVICTGVELPTMAHQDFWITHLENAEVSPSEWIYWLAYDDQVWAPGLAALANEDHELRLDPESVYFGPWAMRHEQPDCLWAGSESDPMEVWTSFPENGPTTLPLLIWIRDQLNQPTYMQMSGSVIPFSNYLELRDTEPHKTGPMRIEMATAAGRDTHFVHEFAHPVSVIYGRSNSDRASYGAAARTEDIHLLRYLAHYARSNPSQIPRLINLVTRQSVKKVAEKLRLRAPYGEEWRVRTVTNKGSGSAN
jgi:hypothetical protein